MIRFGYLLLGLTFLAACQKKEPPAASVRITESDVKTQKAAPTLNAAAAEGKALYGRACINCHGPDGSGGHMRQMMPEIGDLSNPATHQRLTDEAMADVIANGRNKMPGFSQVYSADQIQKLIGYVRTLKAAGS